MSALADNPALEESQATVTSDIPATVASVKDGWSWLWRATARAFMYFLFVQRPALRAKPSTPWGS